jgi:hypothetical protein
LRAKRSNPFLGLLRYGLLRYISGLNTSLAMTTENVDGGTALCAFIHLAVVHFVTTTGLIVIRLPRAKPAW